LRFRPDRTFTIVQFTDVHWRNGDAKDQQTRALMDAVLDAERPDLVALTGDIVEGSEAPDPAEAYRQAVAVLEERQVPWAAVFGNHDDEGDASRLHLFLAQREGVYCRTERGPSALTGIGNYVLRILGDGGELAAALYFLDSNGYNDRGIGDYAWIAQDQIAWYRSASAKLGREYAGPASRLPALAFFHIPLPEYAEVWASGTCRGQCNEPVCAPALNSGFFTALVEQGDVMATFVGHDHVNDFEGDLHGIRLCYGRATGYPPYGQDGFARGARVIRLRQGERAFETWRRLDDGQVATT
jgi:3',5'-cyclic AMP phosphodiesterase CpdA